MCFSKDTSDYLGCTNKWNEPMLSNFGSCEGRKGLENGPIWDHNCEGRKGLENGPIWDHKWLKNGSKPWFSKNDPGPDVVPNRMNTSHFEPLLSRAHPLSLTNFICCSNLLDDVPCPTSSVPIFNPGLG